MVTRLNDRTQAEREEDIRYLTTLPLKELRKRQDLIEAQITTAYRNYDTPALENLQAMQADHGAAVYHRTLGGERDAFVSD